MSPKKKSLVDKIINEFKYGARKVKEATSFAEPVTTPLNKLIDDTYGHSIPGLYDEGVGRILNSIGNRLGVDPTALALVGMVAAGKGGGKFKLPKRASTGDPIARARTAKTPKSVDTNPKKLKLAPDASSSDLPRGAAPGNRQDLARRAEQKINTNGGSVSLDIKGDIYAEAYGPVVKKFGAHPKDIADQRAFIDADGPIPVNPGTKGRPSATNSSPALRQLREGKRKSTGLQAVKDRLNQGRSSNPPKQSTAPRSVSAEQSLKNTKTLEDQLKRNADDAVRDRLGFDTRRGSSVPEEAVDFSRRRRGLPSEPSRQPVRRDRRGRIIKDKRPESTGSVQGRSVGKKGRPAVDRRGKPYTPARTSKSPNSGRTSVKGPDNTSIGRSFDNSGELRGLTTKGQNTSGRSPQQIKQTRATLKARIEHLRGLPWSQERSRRIQRMQALLKKMR